MREGFDPSLYLVTDSTLARGRPLAEIVRAALAGGVTMVQYREKQLGTRAMIEEARAVLGLTRAAGVPLIVNDRVDVALAIDADGVHLGREDMDPATARRLLGPDKIIGASVHEAAHLDALDPELVDYVGAGAVFPTGTKSNIAGLLGIKGVARLRRATALPMVAIAGINAENAAEVIATDVDGIAVVSAIVATEDPKAAAAQLKSVIQTARKSARLPAQR